MKKRTNIEEILMNLLAENKLTEGLRVQYYLNIQGFRHYLGFSFPQIKLAILTDGDYWHGLHGYWTKRETGISNRIRKNMRRDHRTHNLLWSNGWTVIRFSETDIKNHPSDVVNEIKKSIFDKKFIEKREKDRAILYEIIKDQPLPTP